MKHVALPFGLITRRWKKKQGHFYFREGVWFTIGDNSGAHIKDGPKWLSDVDMAAAENLRILRNLLE